MVSRKKFLLACRRKGIFPPHISKALKCTHEMIAENGPFVNKVDRMINRFKKSILNLEIKQTFYKIGTLHRKIQDITPTIIQQTSQPIADRFIELQSEAFRNHLYDRNRTTSRKLSGISDDPGHPRNPICFNETAITNATTIQVPNETMHLLSLGPKFALPHTDIQQVPLYHVMADVENILRTDQRKQVQDQNRCRVVNAMTNFIHSFSSSVKSYDPVVRFCASATRTTTRFLKSHTEICILSADKGNRTVIMYKEDYNQKMRTLIEDDETYTKVNRDPTSSFQSKNNNIVRRLKDLKLINEYTARQLTRHDSVCPRIYGQPKAHKPGLPLRPVIPNMTAPTYMLSKFVAQVLQESLVSKYNTISSFAFCQDIQNTKLPEGYIIISLDVVSLFTNVPRELVRKSIIDRWSEIITEINLDLFIEIVDLCMDASFFRFEGQYYRQVFGTAMGSPLSPILADIALDTVIDKAMSSLPFPIPILKKYVDDIFMAIPTDAKELVLDAFNRHEVRLQFTLETEVNGKLPYLDMTLPEGC
ncbi:uncharacterized protein LOC134289353 [Aedes albopictus]|uniref:Reverse transcriptase domain-containing protein n=1 Tax=Aedes albopictus TaxID=7160 RepID=A0ABM1YM39_AEDAL